MAASAGGYNFHQLLNSSPITFHQLTEIIIFLPKSRGEGILVVVVFLSCILWGLSINFVLSLMPAFILLPACICELLDEVYALLLLCLACFHDLSASHSVENSCWLIPLSILCRCMSKWFSVVRVLCLKSFGDNSGEVVGYMFGHSRHALLIGTEIVLCNHDARVVCSMRTFKNPRLVSYSSLRLYV